MNPLPDNILRRMSKADRQPLGKAGVTSAECIAKAEARSEKDVQRQISNWLRLHEVWFSNSRTDRRTTNGNGCPDYLLVARCRYPIAHSEKPLPVAIEVKFQAGKLSPDQERVKEQMIKNGWQYFVVHSLEEVIDLIRI